MNYSAFVLTGCFALLLTACAASDPAGDESGFGRCPDGPFEVSASEQVPALGRFTAAARGQSFPGQARFEVHDWLSPESLEQEAVAHVQLDGEVTSDSLPRVTLLFPGVDSLPGPGQYEARMGYTDASGAFSGGEATVEVARGERGLVGAFAGCVDAHAVVWTRTFVEGTFHVAATQAP